jgi:esterase/lipase superfamily enzyme
MSTDIRTRFRLSLTLFASLLALGAAAGANAADFDLCVRGSSLDETRTARLQLTVEGADVSAFAPRLGAVLANRRFWNNSAEDVFGAPYDAELCGEEIAPLLKLAVTLTPSEAQDLQAEMTRGSGAGLIGAVERMFGAATPAEPPPQPPGDNAPVVGDAVLDASGKLRYHIMRVYYATNRKATASPAPDAYFAGDRAKLSYGVVNVALPKSHEVGQLEAPSIFRLEFREDPEKHVMLQSLTPLKIDTWRSEIAKRATALGNPGILVFIHGYNSSFSDAARRAGQLAFDLKFGGSTVLFSWPSRAATLEYTVDEQAAEWSIPDMKEVLASIATIAPGAPVYVVAHSMGNRVFTRGFQALLAEDPAKRRPFKQIILAAPDVDADVFTREIGPAILNKGPHFTLYASSNDKALAASRGVHGGYRRLGESGKDIVVLQGLDTVDASSVDTEFLGHSYFGDSGTVMSDLKYVIRKSLPPEQRERFALERVRDAAVGRYWRFKAIAAGAAAPTP